MYTPPTSVPATPLATRREIFAWAMFDFANSGYTTVVLTAIFNVYFVGVIAGVHDSGTATFLWTLAITATNILVLATFWLNYSSVLGDKDEQEAIRLGIVQVMLLVSPFMRDEDAL